MSLQGCTRLYGIACYSKQLSSRAVEPARSQRSLAAPSATPAAQRLDVAARLH
ncbi:uncharacterized protein BDR25DRAFT_302577 [Lindgomyces ingoldianus]|uniref:Uncharacterized protein n=1 Tax=Lindgomyces ingoldianus TaxID=673940 RepID=A0ACB6QZS1_9PLEO|nr:uncharacterized protein BDR25DRAFT_302577 [Lindgomyces ingoldianus]KAF2472335.1 hypothetical protein BDR25DRAFT_302577 [Lindgomyces ingoldianus]